MSLFDGETLAGWDGAPAFWSVEEGCIVGESTPERPCGETTWLVWRGGSPANFRLALEFRIRGGNSGVQFRSREVERWDVAGYQADIEDGVDWTGGLYEQYGRGVVARRGERVHFAEDGGREVERFADGDELLGEIDRNGWNAMVVEADGDRSTVTVNGRLTAELVDRSELARGSGSIALQLHAGPPMRVEFRNLELVDLGGQREEDSTKVAARFPEEDAAPEDTAEATGEPGAPAVALDAEELELAPGFRAELLYSVPKEERGSWVSLTSDDRGRLIASDQYGGLYRITPPPIGPPGTGGEALVEDLAIELGEAHGLLHAKGALYAVVCAAGRYESGLYRARDTDGDDRYDEILLLAPFDGDGEHGPHAVRLGPDGDSLYVIAGNHTKLPAGLDRTLVPRIWEEDQLLARISDPGGHAVDRLAPGGWLARTDLDGGSWELVAAGMRNAYDFDFDESGEPFTFDSDMEWDVGLPWYRPTRILHLVSGADFGWRHGSGKWPAWAPDSLPAVVDVGLSSPTGVTFGTGADFPGRWRRALFAADWAYGAIHAVHLAPDGASFTGKVEPFVSGRPLPVTDLVVAPDGALYFTTGGRRTQSGLYRVTWTGAGDELDSVESPAPGPVAAAPAVRLRRELERLHGRRAPGALLDIWEALDHPDRFVRHAARTALEFQEPALWAERALFEERTPVAIQALLALVRVRGGEPRRDRARVAALPWSELEGAELLDALRLAEVTLARHGGDPDADRALAAALGPRFPTGVDAADRALLRLLARVDAPDLAPRAVDRLLAAETQEEQIGLAYGLRALASGWTVAARERFLRWLAEDAAGFHGGNSLEQYVARIRDDTVATLGPEADAFLASLTTKRVVEAASPAPAARLVREWTLADLVPSLPRVESGRSFDSGREAYRRAQCYDCHRLAGEGGSQGPDLTGAGGRFSARDLLRAIVEPTEEVSDEYRDTEVWTTAGRVFVGRFDGIADGRIRLRPRQTPEVLHEIDLAEVEERRDHPLSPMPTGLCDTLTEEEILDLLAYVLAGGDATDAAFVAVPAVSRRRATR